MTEKLDISNPISVVNEPKQGVTIDDVEEDATALAASLICVAAASALLHVVSSVFHSLLSTVSTVQLSTQLSPSCGGGRLAPPAVPAAVPANCRGHLAQESLFPASSQD